MAEKKRNRLIQKLRNTYRLVIMDNETLEERFSVRLTRMNAFIFTGTVIILLIVATIYIIAFTPLKEYIPGYADFNTRQVLRELSLRADSLERDLRQKDLYILNIRNIVEGRDLVDEIPDTVAEPEVFSIDQLPRSPEDSILRAEMEQVNREGHQYWDTGEIHHRQPVVRMAFFPPLTGMISSHFDPSRGHYGVDVVADQDEIIKSALDGTVIFAGYTIDTGYTIGIQHANDIITIYKHNSSLLKQQGNFVRAGEPIAVIGDTGIYSTGTHLHFELWFDGNPVNPADYISFE